MTGPGQIVETEHLWIPMPDGTRLAARLWLPATATRMPVPAVFEYIPYRKADMVRARDARNHPFLAQHGYAALRVDMRGSGDSEGDMPDMYHPNELADARHVIAWLAAQPWCNGRVGMFGTSWGGTASLQANLDAPDALKAVIAVCATHDRYDDDIHHMGGCLITDTFEWGATLPAILAAPPTPHIGADWLERWKERLATLAWPVEHWVTQEARGTYWRHGSVTHQADRLRRPILAIGGWSDRYSNSVMSLSAARSDLVWGIVGPWGHHYPDHGHPGPAISFQEVALDWWDHWLKGRPYTAPRLRVWCRQFDTPVDAIDTRQGHWVASGAIAPSGPALALHLTDEGLRPAKADTTGWRVPADLRVGLNGGDTGYFGRFGGLPLDQALPDSFAVHFDGPPLTEAVVLYGKARVTLRVRHVEPRQQILLRLCDVAPGGQVAQVCFTVANLALVNGEDSLAQEAGPAPREVEIDLPSQAYLFKPGHRLRLSLGSSCWPLVWPSPDASDVDVLGGQLELPLLEASAPSVPLPFPPPLDLPAPKAFHMRHAPSLQRHSEVTEHGTLRAGWHQPLTEIELTDIATRFAYETEARFEAQADDPLSVRSEHRHMARYTRPDGVAEINARLVATSDAENFLLHGEISVQWNGASLLSRSWQRAIPRRFG